MLIRFFDMFFSGIFLIILSPLFTLIIVLLKFTGEGEIFFFQERVGKDRKMFNLFKFVTMIKDSPKLGSGTVTMKNDPRVLPLGKVLRKFKLNELPQLLNVFLGSMSLIGPRPQAIDCFEIFPQESKKEIVKVKPGLSGIGPIVFRDEENILQESKGTIEFYNKEIGPYKGQVEAWYVKKQSLRINLFLIILTIWVIVLPKSGLIWRVFRDLPTPPSNLKSDLNYPY